MAPQEEEEYSSTSEEELMMVNTDVHPVDSIESNDIDSCTQKMLESENQKVVLGHKVSGGLYDGQIEMLDGNFSRHGFGSFKCNEWTYKGQWLNDKRHGFGHSVQGNEQYIGEWKNDKKNGFGTEAVTVTSFFRIFYLMNPMYTTVYRGEFRDGLKHGVGYEGDSQPIRGYWHNGVKTDNDPYHGGRDDQGKKSGLGIQTYSDGSVYEGEWKEGQRSGQGCFTDGPSLKYEGQWLNDKRHGYGKEIHEDVVSDGLWVNGAFCKGTIEGSFVVRRGIFLDRLLCGAGEKQFKDGSVECGIFSLDRLNGPGKQLDVEGKLVEEGIYVLGKLQK